jgi:2-methylcitrate dehydratase PrpD
VTAAAFARRALLTAVALGNEVSCRVGCVSSGELGTAFRRIGKHAYQPESLRHPEILALARKVQYYADPVFPGPGRFKGAVRIRLTDGRTVEEVEEYNRGSIENPMSEQELRAKFDENASAFLGPAERSRLADNIMQLEALADVSVLVSASAH